MPEATNHDLRQLVAFNSDLQDLIAAGLPLRWNAVSSPQQTAFYSSQVIQKASSLIPLQTSPESHSISGDTLQTVWPSAFEGLPTSPSYLAAYTAWQATKGHPDSLLLMNDVRTDYLSANAVWIWRFQLRLLIVLAISTYLIWQFMGGTTLRRCYEQSSIQPGPIGATTTAINAWLLTKTKELPLSAKLAGLSLLAFVMAWFLFWPAIRKRPTLRLKRRSQEGLVKSRFLDLLQKHGYSPAEAFSLFPSLLTAPIPAAPALVTSTSQVNDLNNADSPPAESHLQAKTMLRLLAAQWGSQKKSERQLHREANISPFLTYILVGGFITIVLAIVVTLPMYEYIYELAIKGEY